MDCWKNSAHPSPGPTSLVPQVLKSCKIGVGDLKDGETEMGPANEETRGWWWSMDPSKGQKRMNGVGQVEGIMWKHQERKLRTSWSEWSYTTFFHESKRKETKLVGVQIILEGRARNPFRASTFSAQWEVKSVPNGEGRGIDIEDLKRKGKVWMSLWEEGRRALPGKHDLPCRSEHLTQVVDQKFPVAQSAKPCNHTDSTWQPSNGVEKIKSQTDLVWRVLFAWGWGTERQVR